VEGMKQYPSNYFDLAIVDPPYGLGDRLIKGGAKDGMGSLKKLADDKLEEWDKKPDGIYFTELFRVSKNQIIWGANYFLNFLNETDGMIVWDKMNGTNALADYEMAWTNFGRTNRMFRMHHFSNGYGKKIHPCQKPKPLYKFCFEYAKLKKGANILDTHLGSGNSRIVAKRMDFNFVGYEIDKGYFDAANENYEKEVNGIIKIDNQKIVTQVLLF
jgi:site-specific DNA-methyltransferase (adenine-specific)